MTEIGLGALIVGLAQMTGIACVAAAQAKIWISRCERLLFDSQPARRMAASHFFQRQLRLGFGIPRLEIEWLLAGRSRPLLRRQAPFLVGAAGPIAYQLWPQIYAAATSDKNKLSSLAYDRSRGLDGLG